MWLILLEALVALGLLLFLVWWTMFAGRKPPVVEADPAGPGGPQGERRAGQAGGGGDEDASS